MPCDAITVAVACGDRGVSFDMGRRPLVRRRWRLGCGVFQPPALGMPPKPPRPPRSPRQFRLRSRTSLVPSYPASRQKVSRSRRTAAFGCLDAARQSSRASRRFAPAAFRRVAHPCPMPVHLPGDSENALASRKRHPGVGVHALATAPNAGFPPAVWSPSLPEWPPTMPHKGGSKDGSRVAPAPKRHQRRVFSTLAAAALQRRLAPRHYPFTRESMAPPTLGALLRVRQSFG